MIEGTDDMPRGQYDRTARKEQSAENSALVSPRASEERRERRRRDAGDIDRTARMKLAIPQHIEEQLHREGKTARWVRDDTGRMHQMKSEDWDIVDGVEPVAASRTDEGHMVLMSKYADWYHDDRKHLKDQNDAMQKSAVSPNAQEDVDPSGFYTPKGTVNKIS
jgi:hypothetical protein